MADDDRRYEIPVVFEIASGTDREHAGRVLHALLTSWGGNMAEVPVLDERGAITHPVQSWWFPESALKHIDGDTREGQRLRSANAFIDEYEDTPVMDLLAEVFPQGPNPDDYRDAAGEFDEDAWGIAFDTFTSEALDLAIKVTRIDDLIERLDRAESLRDDLADLLERDPLPEEPHPDDYLITVAPNYPGDIDDALYAEDHAHWEAAFHATALAREQHLRQLLTDGGGRSPVLPPRFQNEWVPRDLMSLQALRDLVDQEDSPDPPTRLLSRDVRAQLRAMLHAADLQVRLREADGSDRYTGHASHAAAVLPAGVYDATTLSGDEPARLVVGPAGRHNALHSAAFLRGDHHESVINEIALAARAVPDQELRARLEGILATVGRTAERIIVPTTRLEHGILLNELLRQRRERLGSDGSQAPRSVDPPTLGAGSEEVSR